MISSSIYFQIQQGTPSTHFTKYYLSLNNMAKKKKNLARSVTLPEPFVLKDYKITIPVSIGRKVAAFDQGDFNEVCIFGNNLYHRCFCFLGK